MFNHQASSLLRRQLRQRHHGLQQFAHISHRQCGQGGQFQLLHQPGILRIRVGPIQFGLSDEPSCQNRQRQVMFPRPVFLRLEFVPARFRLRILIGPFDKMAHALQPGQAFMGRIGLARYSRHRCSVDRIYAG
jgi:hypothetical protein